ncbi:MAG: alkaline phosphatase family protein [Anaerolineae bacterium]|jgi:hypothetical protein
MPKYARIFLSLLILAAAAIGAYRGADALQQSVTTYRSPLSMVRIPLGEPMPAQTQRVVVVVIGGLGYAAARSLDMPNMEALLEAGASAPMISRPPTYSSPAWTTMVTGVWPELNNAPILKTDAPDLSPIALDQLFAAAHDAGLRTAIAGPEEWRQLLPTGTPDASFYSPQEDAIADSQVAQAAFTFIGDSRYNLILVHFNQVNAAGRASGVDSPAYANAAWQVDNYLRQITRLLGLSESVLIVTSDHGLMEDGRWGGGESDLTQLPFVMIGQHILPGDYSPVRQIDLAPTAATLLGTRLPAAAQGRPLYEMMQLDAETLTRGQLQLATQKVALGDAYLMYMGKDGLSQATHQDLVGAQQTLLKGNHAGALQLAKLVAEEATVEMKSATADRIDGERLWRLGGIGVGLLLSLLFFWGWRGPNSLANVIGAGTAVTIYYGLYRLRGYTFSLSAVGDSDLFVTTLVRYAAIGLVGGGLLVLAWLLYQDERRWLVALIAGYDYGLLATFLSALPALVGYWQHGATVRWYLPDLVLTLLHFTALIQMGVAALLALLLPWFVALVAWVVGRWRAHSEARAQAWDPIARLRHE